MKVLNAHWEKRNLGILCNEILIEDKDEIDEIKDKLGEFETEYTVVKVPTNKVEFLFFLQKEGYFFIELITHCFNKSELPVLTNVQQRLIDSMRCELMDFQDFEYLFSQIKNNLFIEDRISVDKRFTNEQSNNRYLGWLNDELENGVMFYKLIYKDNFIGFFTLQDKGNNIYFASLGGIFSDYQKFGFGFCMNYFEIIEGKKMNAKKIMTSYSSNNRAVSALHLSMGYHLDEQYYVFVKHSNNKNHKTQKT
jgi:hypothetical protein